MEAEKCAIARIKWLANPDWPLLWLVLPGRGTYSLPATCALEWKSAKFYLKDRLKSILSLRPYSLYGNYSILPLNWKQLEITHKRMGTGCIPTKLYWQKLVASPRAMVCWLLFWSKGEYIISELKQSLCYKSNISAGIHLLCPLAVDLHVNRLNKEDKVSRWRYRPQSGSWYPTFKR